LWRKDTWDESVLLKESSEFGDGENGGELAGFYDFNNPRMNKGRLTMGATGGLNNGRSRLNSFAANPYKVS